MSVAGPHRIGLIGFGTIAQAAHVPAILADAAFDLVAVADPSASLPADVAGFRDYRAMLDAPLAIDAVAISTPPALRCEIAIAAMAAGKHVLLEKPPAATPDEVAIMADGAARHGRVLFAAWHSRYNDAVERARIWLAGRVISGFEIIWKEDVCRWHPGQDWIWRHGGFGVFDAGINALSVMTHILPAPVRVLGAELWFGAGAEAPIAATVAFAGGNAIFDWRPISADVWEIAVTTSDGHHLILTEGGRRLLLDGAVVPCGVAPEYRGVYAHFERLLRGGTGCVDDAPLALVAEALRLGVSRSV